MHSAKSRSVPSGALGDIDESYADATLRSSPPDVTVKRLVEEDRALVRGHRPGKAAAPATSATATYALAIGVTSIADIEKLMEDLLAARDYLQSEGERVRQVNARYTHLAKTASASAKIIAESLGKWRNTETTTSQAAAPLPSRAATLAPVHDDELERQNTEPEAQHQG
jgi:hypothetical protein